MLSLDSCPATEPEATSGKGRDGMEIRVIDNPGSVAGELDVEFVERKGVGHPDTMCDAIAERASRYYSRHCLEEFGRVAHHWFDKVMLIGGESRLTYGEGRLVRPYRVVFAGKAALAVGARKIPLEAILRRAAEDVLAEVLTGFVPERHLETDVRVVDYQGSGRGGSRYRPRSEADLVAVGEGAGVSNDSNLVSAFAPLTMLESMVLELERHLNGPGYKRRNPATGWDIKILGRRRAQQYRLVVNVPFLAAHVSSLSDYGRRKAALRLDIEEFLQERFTTEVELLVNATDRNGRPYLTALGSVADTGDVGMVGRGNRANGLITLMRPMSIEAAAGKNPIDHTGKLYCILAQAMAEAIHEQLRRPTEVFLFTSKEAPLEDPDEIVVRLEGWTRDEEEDRRVRDLVNGMLSRVGSLSADLIEQGRPLW
jgi:S-adenosylmethionine synthetase